MFLKLLYFDGTPFRIRPEVIQTYGAADTNGANAYVSDAENTYYIKETVEEIDKYFEDIQIPDADDPKRGWR